VHDYTTALVSNVSDGENYVAYFEPPKSLTGAVLRGRGTLLQFEVCPPLPPQINFLVSVTRHMGRKFIDYVSFCAKKLHILPYDNKIFPVTALPPARQKFAATSYL